MSSLRRSQRIADKLSAILPKSDGAQNSEHGVSVDLGAATKSSVGSRGTSKLSLVKRRHLEADLEASRKLADIERDLIRQKKEEEANRKLAEIEKDLIKKQLEVEKMRIMEEEGICYCGEDAEMINIVNDENVRNKEIQDWINEAVPSPKEIYPERKNTDATVEKFIARQTIKAELPYFSGNPVEWPNFITQLKETTAMCGYSNRENNYRLHRCLQGKAKETVEALLYLPDSFEKIISMLERRFGRPEYIVSELIEKVKRIAAPKEEKLNTIIDFSNAVQNLVATMKYLQTKNHLSNPQLLKELLEKLPTNYMLQWGDRIRRSETKSLTIEDFSCWLEEIADSASYIYIILPKFGEEDDKKRRCKDTTLIASEEYEKRSVECTYCYEQGHYVAHCEEYRSLDIDNK